MTGSPVPFVSRRPTVLILEDDPLIAMDIETTLADAGFGSLWATQNDQALELLARHRFDCALLDVQLADGDSAVLAEALAKAGVPFAVTTGMREDDIESAALHAAPYIEKPFPPGRVVEEVQALMSRTQAVDDRSGI